MESESKEFQQLHQELAYYKSQLDRLAGNTIKDQYALSQLNYDLSQLRKGFQIIADIQRNFNGLTSPDTLYANVLDAIQSNMATDRVILLKPNPGRTHLKPYLWKGYSYEEVASFESIEIPISNAFPNEKKSLLMNSQISPTEFEQDLQRLFLAPYFVFTPLLNDGKLSGALFVARNVEHRLLSTKSYSQSSVDTFESIAGMISAFTQQLEKSKVMERERIRIARDMHDVVGSELSKISIACENIKKQNSANKELAAQLTNVQNAASRLVDNIGNIIWALNPVNNNTISLVGYLREYAFDYLEMNHLPLTFQAPDLSDDLPVRHEARTHIFMVVKESLHNIVKHAKANQVTIQISINNNVFSCSVSDTGIGFSPKIIHRFGNGLRNMEQRVAETGGTFSITSIPGKGTKVQLNVPL